MYRKISYGELKLAGMEYWPDIVELVKQYAGEEMPIVKTDEIGHGSNSKGIVIGAEICLKS